MTEHTEENLPAGTNAQPKPRTWMLFGVTFLSGALIGFALDRVHLNLKVRADEAREIQAEEEGYVLNDVNMNSLISWLSKQAGMQYFYNTELDNEIYNVQGHMSPLKNPKTEIESLALAFGLHIRSKDDTLYVLITDQYENWDKLFSEQRESQEEP